ncbi:NAD(+) diphosphatase [Corynebacterium pacaense]|uniref:NAD(+) diphosphatase n=1 Tax=Corynebacterium pacaense TaxID=1816684 RepID=UPI0009BA6FF7|nr:NUDIX domain-containing protein [Corynebacterium pacaense]
MNYLPVGPRDEVPVRGGRAVFLDGPDHSLDGDAVAVAPGVWAVRVAAAVVEKHGRPVAPRELRDPLVDAAVALLRNRERVRFDPADGSELTYDEHGVAFGASGRPVFPRVDPAVIGIVELKDAERLLLGMNAQRRTQFSLIAGYVSHGETLEAAFEREVMEESGRLVTDIRYVASQPWPVSGSIMVGMRGVTADEEQRADTDGELAEIVWASRSDILDHRIPIAAPGSIAHDLIMAWAREK